MHWQADSLPLHHLESQNQGHQPVQTYLEVKTEMGMSAEKQPSFLQFSPYHPFVTVLDYYIGRNGRKAEISIIILLQIYEFAIIVAMSILRMRYQQGPVVAA